MAISPVKTLCRVWLGCAGKERNSDKAGGSPYLWLKDVKAFVCPAISAIFSAARLTAGYGDIGGHRFGHRGASEEKGLEE
jgi:hypothetical protein